MKFIKEDGMVIEEEDGIIHTWELLSRIHKARKHNKEVRANQKAKEERRSRLSPEYRRQKEINAHIQPLKFNWGIFCLLLLFWPAAVAYVILYRIRKNRE